MNKVILMGRLTRDPEVRYTQGEKTMAVARYTLAVDRRGGRNNSDGPTADFINCVAFDKRGEFAEKYLRKGMRILVTGHIQTGSYTNREGQKVYTTDVIVDEHEFTESKAGNAGNTGNTGNTGASVGIPSDIGDGFMDIPDGYDGLPFN